MIHIKDLVLSPINKPLNLNLENGKLLNLKLTKESKTLLLLYLNKTLNAKQAEIILDTPVLSFFYENIPKELYLKEFIKILTNKLSMDFSSFWLRILEVLARYGDKDLIYKRKIADLNDKEKARFTSYCIIASDMPNLVFCDLDLFDDIYLSKLKQDLKQLEQNSSSVLILTSKDEFSALGELINYDIV